MRITRSRVVAAGIAALALASTAVAQAASHHSLKLTGPSSNKLGTNFDYTLSGSAGGKANFIVAWEQFIPGKGCASTYAAESTRGYSGNNFEITLWDSGKVSGHFSRLELFGADHAGKHGMCAYLINLATGTTYAHASAFWVNHP